MNCDHYRIRVHELLREAVSDSERHEIEEHAESCADCSAYLQTCKELTCREFVEFLNAYMAQELSAERSGIFDRHISVCQDCLNYLATYRKTMDLSVAALTELSPGEIPEELVRAIMEAREKN
jgi:anti-sigma factor RsiW